MRNTLISRVLPPIVSLLLSILPHGSLAADERGAVQLLTVADDSAGNRLAFALKERLASSSVFRPYRDGDRYFLIVSIKTMQPSQTVGDAATIYSVAFQLGGGGYLLWHTVGVCGASRVDSCAQGLLAELDRQLNKRVQQGE